jgi:hypothetical protein
MLPLDRTANLDLLTDSTAEDGSNAEHPQAADCDMM